MRAVARAVPLFALLACASEPPKSPREAVRGTPHETTHDATIFYSTAKLGATHLPFPLPLVRGTVAGHATTMIVDTGAHIPVVAAWLADGAGLSTGAPIVGRDSAGRAVPMRRAEHPAMAIDGWGALLDRPTAVADLPTPFREVGVGAIVSPQALASESEVVVLDLASGHLTLVAKARAPAGPRSADEVELAGTHLCTYDSDGVHASSLVADVTVDGTTIQLDVDTGSNGISIGRGTELGRRLAAREGERTHGIGAAGEFEALRVPDVPVHVGPVDASAPVAVVVGAANPQCRTHGRIGVDYLRACVFVIGQDTLRISCRPPPISTGNARCDACMSSKCPDAVDACRHAPSRCGGLDAPEGVRFQTCANQACREACGGP